MKVMVEFTCDGSAFVHNDAFSQIMDQVLDKIWTQLKRPIATHCTSSEEADKIRDYNGNIIGSLTVEK